MTHTHHMNHAIRLANSHRGMTGENPSVGAVVVQEGIVVGAAATAVGGVPHAEVLALAQAGARAKGATLYVTLEPCSHHGKTGPCAEIVVKSGVKKVFIGVLDPNPQISGKGAEILKNASIDVEIGLCEDEARWVHRGFLSRMERGRPWVTVKIATSLDGKIALSNGKSQWISSETSRNYAHLLRAHSDAIMVGAGTVRADDPSLTCRLPGLEAFSPRPVIIGANVPSDATLLKKEREVIHFDQETAVELEKALHELGNQGINHVLVEGGAGIITSLLNNTGSSASTNLIDELIWIQAPKIIGDDGQGATYALALTDMADCQNWQMKEQFTSGEDMVRVLVR